MAEKKRPTKRGPVLYRGDTVIFEDEIPIYGGQVLVKEPARGNPSSQETEALDNEYEITRRLCCEGVRMVLGKENRKGGPVLILQPIKGKTLREYLLSNRQGLEERLRLAVSVANAVHGIHKENVIHNDLTASNMLVSENDRSVFIIDFGSAVWRDGGATNTRTTQLKRGSLPYLPPERAANRELPFDYRTDTYSLGVVLYEILTNRLPFQSEDPQALFHEHVARKPTPPSLINPDIPDVLDRIIFKLLAKDPDERYQSVFGVLKDLGKCIHQYEQNRTISNFPLAAADPSGILRIPDKLYGRGEQLERLTDLIEKAAGGSPELILVSGYPGIGKTVLVQEMRNPTVGGGGLFIQGKAEQYRSDVPYTVITTAFHELVTTILSKPERELAKWKKEISEALGNQGTALADIVPGLEKIIGTQKEVAFLGGQEAQNRLNYLIRKLIGALTSLARPFVVFLDDLQWVDSASLNLLNVLITDRDLYGFCVIGAYRDNEVGDEHPLATQLADIENKGIDVRKIVLENLDLKDLSILIAETLGPAPGIDALSSLLFDKTLGNPFFTKHLLYSLYESNQIRLDMHSRHWKWEIGSLRALDISENVVDSLASTVGVLESKTQEVLTIAACAGACFDPSVISRVMGESLENIIHELQKPNALRLLEKENKTYRFVHDRIQQAIYGLVDDTGKSRCNLEIGRLLLQDFSEEQMEEAIFDIVDHLNAGVSLVDNQQERNDIARLNLRAGRKARDSAAFAAMLRYLDRGIDLLARNSWQTAYALTLELYTMVLEAEYLNTNFERAQKRAEIILHRARSVLDTIRAYEITMMCCFARYRMHAAIDIGKKVLGPLGVSLLHGPPPDFDVQYFRRLPAMTDSESLAAMRILILMFPPAMIAKPELLPSVVFTLINQCLTKGNSDYSAFAYALYGMYLCQDPEGIARGSQFGKLALQMLGSSESNKMGNRVREIVYCFIDSWQSKHLRDVMDDMRRLIQSSLESGETEIACNQLMSLCILLYCVGEPLESARALQAEYIRSIGELKQGFQLRIAKVWAQLLLNLSGLAEDANRLIGPYFDEEQMLPQLEHGLGLTGFYSYLPVAIHSLFTGDYEKSLKHTQMAGEQMPQLFGFPVAATHAAYHALAMLQLYPKAGTKTQKEYLQALEPIRQKMASLFRRGSINWQHDYYLIEAETARVLGEFDRALQFYEKAIAVARNNRYPNFEALGCELAGRFCLDRGLEGPSEYYLTKAHALYKNWGLMLKVRDLEQRYPDLLNPQQVPAQASPYQQGSTLTSSGLDLDSSLKALRALSSETDLEALLNRMMDIVMEHAGAEKGILLLKQDGHWLIQATGDFQKKQYFVLLNLPYTSEGSDHKDGLLPASVVNLCLRSEQPLLVPKALSDIRFGSDPYIRRYGVKSILCLPLLYQARLNGVLYLENRLTSEVFGNIKLEMLELLCTQFSISFDNALLYQTLAERLSFEKLISALSATFVNLPANEVGRQLELWLEKLVDFLEVDRGAVYEFSANHEQLALTHYYGRPETPRPPAALEWARCYASKTEHDRIIIFRRPQDLPSQAEEGKRHLMKQGIVSYIGVPMSVGGTLLGVIEFASFHREKSWGNDIVERLRLIEEIFAQALKRKISEETLQRRTTELKETAEKLKNLSEHLQEVREYERANIAREIHDELGQALTVLRMNTSWIARHRDEKPALLVEQLRDMIALIDSATGTVQRICSELRPQMLDVLGLFDAIEWQAKEFQRREGISCQVTLEGPEIEEEKYVIVLFRIVQEALTNVSRHAEASKVAVRLDVDKQRVLLEIDDDGRGITPEQVFNKRSLGLIGMRERVSFLNGKLDIAGTKGRGTHLRVTLPMKGER